MSVNGFHQFAGGGFELHRQAQFGEHFGGIIADQMGADELIKFVIKDQLHETLGMADRFGLARGNKLEAADLDLPAIGSGLLFGQADRGDLGLAVRAAGDLTVIDRGRMPDDMANRSFTLEARLVGEELFASHVADGVDLGV